MKLMTNIVALLKIKIDINATFSRIKSFNLLTVWKVMDFYSLVKAKSSTYFCSALQTSSGVTCSTGTM